MKKLFNFVFLIPLAVILIVLSVANRTPARFSLDPLNIEAPAISLQLPLFILLFMAFAIGLIVGGSMVWWKQGKHRKALRKEKYEANQLRREVNTTKQSTQDQAPEIAPGLPMVSKTS